MMLLQKKSNPQDLQIAIELSDRHKVISPDETKGIYNVLSDFAEKFSRHIELNSVEATVDAYHNKTGKITNFDFHLRVHPVSGKGFMTRVEDKKLMNAVHNAIDKIKQQSNHLHLN